MCRSRSVTPPPESRSGNRHAAPLAVGFSGSDGASATGHGKRHGICSVRTPPSPVSLAPKRVPPPRNHHINLGRCYCYLISGCRRRVWCLAAGKPNGSGPVATGPVSRRGAKMCRLESRSTADCSIIHRKDFIGVQPGQAREGRLP